MAYARFGFDSEVGVTHDGIKFHCIHDDGSIWSTREARLMLAHLRALECDGISTGAAIHRITEEIAAGKWQ